MLFIIVMDVLNSLVQKALDFNLLHPLFRRGNGQRLSLYADDSVLFVQPRTDELLAVKEVLRIFGEATGLITNINKSSVTPIRCDPQKVAVVTDVDVLPCKVTQFPCKYLGMPLSVKKLAKNDFYPLIDAIADRLPGWKAVVIHPASRATLIKSVLSAIPIYQLIALQCPNSKMGD